MSRPLVAFFIFSFTLASATYGFRSRLGIPEDHGTIATLLRGLGVELLPLAVFLALLFLSIFLELVRFFMPPGEGGQGWTRPTWDGARATLNGLLAFAAVLIPVVTGIVLAFQAVTARLSWPWSVATLMAGVTAILILVFAYLPANLEAVHPGLKGLKLLAIAVALATAPAWAFDWRFLIGLSLTILSAVVVTAIVLTWARRATTRYRSWKEGTSKAPAPDA